MTKRMIQSLAVLISFILILGFQTNALAGKEKIEQKFEKTISLAKDGKVFLTNISGEIDVKVWNRGEVKIDALKTAKADTKAKAEENAKLVKITVKEEGNIIRIKTEYPKTKVKNLNVSTSYNLTVPSGASIQIENVSGNITMGAVGGSVKAHTVSGTVNLAGAKKGAKCSTVSGNVEVSDIAGNVFLETVSGKVTATNVSGNVDAKTTSGEIVLNGIKNAKDVSAEVLSGTVKYTGDIFSDGRYHLKSHSGGVKMMIPANSAFDLDASTFSGSIDTDFDVNVSGKLSKKKISGTVNGGGAEVSLKTFSGSITVKKK
jgi:hypothetical protein